MKPSLRLGKIAGVDVGLHYSWFAVLALVSWSLSSGLLPDRFPGWSDRTYWAAGMLAALALFASVLVHELAHSLVAKARGFPVEGITLFFLGGVSNLKADSRHPRDELIISAVGPLTSFGLAALFGLALALLRDSNTSTASTVWFLTMVDLANSPAAAVVWYLALVNLLLAGFNLLPAFPLDGGRVLRSVVWGITGNISKATRVAAWGGQIVAIALIGLGAFQILQGNLLGGLWFGFIGWFLHTAATGSQRQSGVDTALRGVKVRSVMDPSPPTIRPDALVSEAVFKHFLQRGVRSLPVCDTDTLVGMFTLTDVKAVPKERWSRVTVGDRMTPMPLRVVGPDDDLSHALDLLGRHTVHQLPVLQGERMVGLLSRAHVTSYIHARKELGI